MTGFRSTRLPFLLLFGGAAVALTGLSFHAVFSGLLFFSLVCVILPFLTDIDIGNKFAVAAMALFLFPLQATSLYPEILKTGNGLYPRALTEQAAIDAGKPAFIADSRRVLSDVRAGRAAVRDIGSGHLEPRLRNDTIGKAYLRFISGQVRAQAPAALRTGNILPFYEAGMATRVLLIHDTSLDHERGAKTHDISILACFFGRGNKLLDVRAMPDADLLDARTLPGGHYLMEACRAAMKTAS